MQFIILVAEPTEDFAKRNPADKAAFEAYMQPWFDFSSALREAGVSLGGGALQGPETATCVSKKSGKLVIQDGPHSAAKEQLGGYFLIEVPDFEAAKHWAAKSPTTLNGATELRAIQVLPEGM